MPGRITVVGLGPGDPALRTLGAQRALDSARRIILRTRIHPGLDDLAGDRRVTDCDDLYETLPTFDAVYDGIAERVCRATEDGDVLFAVPGHPRFGERSVALLEDRAGARGIAVDVQVGISALDVVAGAVGQDPLADQVQLVDGLALASLTDDDPFCGGKLGLDPTRPALVTQVYSPAVATAVKLALGRLLPDDHPVAVVRAAGVPREEQVVHCRLHALDRQRVDHVTSVWVFPMPALGGVRSWFQLQRTVARLRAPGGCPWDREQTHATLRNAVLEEAFEVVDAIDAHDPENLAEELGDLLLSAAMHAQIAEEAGDFVFEDVVEAVNRKLIRRHPHVFGDHAAATADAVLRTWQAIKAEERRARGSQPAPEHPLDRLPRAMPALHRTAAVLRATGEGQSDEATHAPEAIGDRLFDAVCEAVRAGLDAETLLAAATRRRVSGVAAESLTERSVVEETVTA